MNVKCKGGGGGGSEGEDGYIFQSPSNANGISSRKRIKLQKVRKFLSFILFMIRV